MAEDKKSFLLYCDTIHVVRKLVEQDRINKTNNAGELLLHLLEYVNDNYPEPVNFIVDMSFEPIKQQLKRDLRKYEDKKVQWSEAGKASAEAKRLAKLNETQRPLTTVDDRSTESTVKGTVKGTGTVKDTNTASTNVDVVGTAAQYDEILKDIKSISNFINTYRPKFIQPYMDLWNLFSEKYGTGKIKSANETRKRKLKVRLGEKNFDFCEILKHSITQKFALESSWFTFDFIIENDNNYVKILENKYLKKEVLEKGLSSTLEYETNG